MPVTLPFSMTGMSYICGGSPLAAQFPTNPIATYKFQMVTLEREEAIYTAVCRMARAVESNNLIPKMS